MMSRVYVVYDVLEKKYEFPFVAKSSCEAISTLYCKIHSVRNSLDAGLGFKQYSYKLYCLGEIEPGAIEPGSLPYVNFDSPRFVAESNFIVEGPNIHEFV